ncbi:MAG: hypothetical protein ACR2PK_01425 [Acidimicrobiales bacterium]
MESTRRPSEHETLSAMKLLGIAPGSTWESARNRYRSEIVKVHPDIDATGAANDRAATLNIAYDTLCRFTDGGSSPLPTAPSARTPTGTPPTHPAQPVVLRTEPGDVFLQLLEGAYRLGDVSYMDPEAGLIQVLLEEGGPHAPQLLIAVDVEGDPPTASFTLDSADSESAPDLPDIVARFGDLLVER